MNKQDIEKIKYYSLDRILKENATYNIIFGKRSNGKTYACLERAIIDVWNNQKKFAIIRRWDDDIVQKNGEMFFSGLVEKNRICEITDGEWNTIYYYARKFYFAKYDENLNKIIKSHEPIGYAFALTKTEHYKMGSYPEIGNIIFDEFLTRDAYLQNEFVLFMNTLSTIIRDRNNISIFMLGNTVNKSSPYWREMGLTDIEKMKVGDIQKYTYGKNDVTVAVEYSDGGGTESNKYFAFNNPRLKMITNGAWELDIYPHLPYKYKTEEIVFTYFIIFESRILQCEIICKNDCMFTYIHEKTGEIKNPKNDIVFSLEFSPLPNYFRKINKPYNELTQKIAQFYKEDKVFYQDNETGEIVRNYISQC